MRRKLTAICLCLFIAIFAFSVGFTITAQTAEATPPCLKCPNCPPGACYVLCDGCCISIRGHLACLY